MQPKRTRYKPGMVYAVPLTDGSYGLAQAGEAMFPTVIYVALFLARFDAPPSEPPKLHSSGLISLTATWRKNLNNGQWLPLGLAEITPSLLEHPTEDLAAAGYVGAKHYDAGLLSEFLSACHGALPWNVMHDPKYYERLLLPGSGRPEKAVVLGEAERTAYRREVFGVVA
jgi:hypothetical protein|tara:strand:- start:50 stop:559 length:510 start_codon:yes stop_codon:yes gene_type:complete